jgi:hypothetical protein
MGLSYHDVIVYINEKSYRIFDCSYGLQLTCTRAGGWELWDYWDDHEVLIGGEYNGDNFRIEVDGIIICNNQKK